MAALLVFLAGLMVLWALFALVADIDRTNQAVRRNYPVIGRFRYQNTLRARIHAFHDLTRSSEPGLAGIMVFFVPAPS